MNSRLLSWPRWLAVSALLGLVLASIGRASVVERCDLERLTALADRIVIGAVVDGTSHWDDAGRTIVTDWQVEVESTLKGDAARRLQLRTSGGVVGEIGQRVVGSARLQPGERYLLFLEDHTDGRDGAVVQRVVGLAQGAYRIARAADGQLAAGRDLSELSGADGQGRLRPLPAEPAVPLIELLTRVQRGLDPSARGERR